MSQSFCAGGPRFQHRGHVTYPGTSPSRQEPMDSAPFGTLHCRRRPHSDIAARPRTPRNWEITLCEQTSYLQSFSSKHLKVRSSYEVLLVAEGASSECMCRRLEPHLPTISPSVPQSTSKSILGGLSIPSTQTYKGRCQTPAKRVQAFLPSQAQPLWSLQDPRQNSGEGGKMTRMLLALRRNRWAETMSQQ